MRHRLSSALLLAMAMAGLVASSCPVAAKTMAVPAGAAIATAASTAPHIRVLPLQGGRNFRDLGGYTTTTGHTVKWGMLFRSGSMHGLTDDDYQTLERRGIRVVCDLRDTRERQAEPVVWPQPAPPQVLSDDYLLDNKSLMPAGPISTWTAESARASLASSYPRMLSTFNGQYRRMFAELLAGHAPLAFNCSAGKDRTGIAAALLLTALGVPRATVIDDYLLTNQTLDTATLLKGKATANSPWTALSPDVMKAFLGADRSYIEAAFKVVDGHKGGARGYLRDELGMGPVQLARLRQFYLD